MPGVDDPMSFAGRLSAAGVGDVRADATTRAMYSSDASLYRVPPAVVVAPRNGEEVAAVLAVCLAEGVPLTARGAGTSIAGNAVGTGVVLDFSRHMNRVLRVDAEACTATVQPGVVQEVLQRAAAPHGLRFGPDPSSSSRCTLGGMIGNNACGTRALGYGRTSDNVVGMRGLAGTGTALDDRAIRVALQGITRSGLATIRTEFGRFGRQVSGYALENLLPEEGFDIARLLVGSEGTLAIATEATVRLVAEPPHRALVVLGYPDIAAAGDATPLVLSHRPVACEGIDSRIVEVVRHRRGPQAVPPLPRGAAWLFVEITGEEGPETFARAGRLATDAAALDASVVTDPAAAVALWRIRADGAGLSGRSPAGLPAYAGWEDAAVPPAALGDYLRDFDALMAEYRLTGLPYGHFGDGCLHIRIDFPLRQPGGANVFREFLIAASGLVAGYGGSLSGEHGDGRARAELLPTMYSPGAIALMAAVKNVFDPHSVLNPGILVEPRPFDADLREPSAPPLRGGLALAYRQDGGDFTQAVHRCTGVGKCRADNAPGAVMCPSYQATREEKDSTRGRARVLQEMVNGTLVSGGWRSPEVHEALDLCLSCKGCRSDCPTGTDMAAYKSEVLYQSYRGRLRPPSHYSLGWLPYWARLASRMPRVVNGGAGLRGIGPAALAMAGVDPRRKVPPFSRQTFRAWFAETARQRGGTGEPVVIFVDSFTNFFTPEVGKAVVRVLQAAGYAPRLTDRQECCGLTWISTGQLDTARKILGRTVAILSELTAPGIPVVGVEPSCTAVLRSDAAELLRSAQASAVSENTHTLAELLTQRGWRPPELNTRAVVAQPHCHHHAVMGWSTDERLLTSAGAVVERLGGCCGLAGNFGVEKGHYEVSMAVADQQLRPAVAAAPADTAILADGFSCRTQLADLTERRGQHLAEFLADYL
jgi:FAD/FMN-containing dehydrogenase/Fe-S oxidoreductase